MINSNVIVYSTPFSSQSGISDAKAITGQSAISDFGFYYQGMEFSLSDVGFICSVPSLFLVYTVCMHFMAYLWKI
jgi:hypothetical protein